MQALSKVEKKLKELKKTESQKENYIVPELWADPKADTHETCRYVNPYDFFLEKIEYVKSNREEKKYIEKPFVYNMLLRHAAAYDHEGSAKLFPHFTRIGFRKTGTFLKGIAMLQYIKSLGADTVYLLPVTSIGQDEKKGTLGSPYAVKNPYKLDENLGEPILDMPVETQFKAFVEAAHLLGMDVILEFVFRTASIDCDWAKEHPEWFYWIKKHIEIRKTTSEDESKYGAPLFKKEELKEIKEKVESGIRKDLLPPHKKYRSFFTNPPEEVIEENGKFYGVENGKIVSKIPSAFADWPPNDVQPPWSDVTYLKLFDHPAFNYIAYNTVRMYDEDLNKDKYKIDDLWNTIIEIIPHYQKNYGIDGILMDMGHSLPSSLRAQIIGKAREINPGFKFWEENFVLEEKSKKDGYDAVVGYMPFDAHIPEKLNSLIKRLSEEGSPLPFFATPETHNTPRAASRNFRLRFSRMIWAASCFLPQIPFIHAGFELGEVLPVNTGLGFTEEEQNEYPPEKLPLFSESCLCWENFEQWTNFLRDIVSIREKFKNVIEIESPESIIPLEKSEVNAIAFLRKNPSDENNPVLLIAASMNRKKAIDLNIKMPENAAGFTNLIACTDYKPVDGELILKLEPWQTVCGEVSF